MSTHKTKVDQVKVATFLKEHFSSESKDLHFISGGESSQAFSFSAKSHEYIIRVNRSDTSFQKDAYAYDHFASATLPIPRIVKIGPLEDQFFAISERVHGKLLQGISKEVFEKVELSFLATLDTIHNTNIGNTSGFGKWNSAGIGEHDSWKEFIRSLNTYKEIFQEREVWERVFGRIEELLAYCPEERSLIHADYGYDNVLYKGKTVTGVIDWGESKYGDQLYDVAWISFWAPSDSPLAGFASVFKESKKQAGIEYGYFDERVRCYELFIGLISLSFYAYSEQAEKYARVKERVLSLV